MLEQQGAAPQEGDNLLFNLRIKFADVYFALFNLHLLNFLNARYDCVQHFALLCPPASVTAVVELGVVAGVEAGDDLGDVQQQTQLEAVQLHALARGQPRGDLGVEQARQRGRQRDQHTEGIQQQGVGVVRRPPAEDGGQEEHGVGLQELEADAVLAVPDLEPGDAALLGGVAGGEHGHVPGQHPHAVLVTRRQRPEQRPRLGAQLPLEAGEGEGGGLEADQRHAVVVLVRVEGEAGGEGRHAEHVHHRHHRLIEEASLPGPRRLAAAEVLTELRPVEAGLLLKRGLQRDPVHGGAALLVLLQVPALHRRPQPVDEGVETDLRRRHGGLLLLHLRDGGQQRQHGVGEPLADGAQELPVSHIHVEAAHAEGVVALLLLPLQNVEELLVAGGVHGVAAGGHVRPAAACHGQVVRGHAGLLATRLLVTQHRGLLDEGCEDEGGGAAHHGLLLAEDTRVVPRRVHACRQPRAQAHRLRLLGAVAGRLLLVLPLLQHLQRGLVLRGEVPLSSLHLRHDLRPPGGRGLGSPLPVLGLGGLRVRLHVSVRLGGGPAPPGRGALLRHPGGQPPHVVRHEAVANVLSEPGQLLHQPGLRGAGHELAVLGVRLLLLDPQGQQVHHLVHLPLRHVLALVHLLSGAAQRNLVHKYF